MAGQLGVCVTFVTIAEAVSVQMFGSRRMMVGDGRWSCLVLVLWSKVETGVENDFLNVENGLLPDLGVVLQVLRIEF